MKRVVVVFVMITGLTTMFMFGHHSKQGTNDKDEKKNSLVETVQVSGTVTNAKDGKPMPGVAVIVKEKNIGAVTDLNGKYLLNVPSDAILLFSFVGMTTQEIAVGNRQVIDVVMEMLTETESQDKILTINSIIDRPGVGTPLYIVDGQEVSDISSISPAIIESISILKDQSAIAAYGEKGKNGMVIITTKLKGSGQVGTPLYIIDGKEVGNVDGIAPESIESITVLKDQSAVEHYGAKAKNGVVIITSKK